MSFIGLVFVISVIYIRFFYSKKNRKANTVGFFHPYCHQGGGGERVLWCFIDTIQRKFPEQKVVIYSATSMSVEDLVEKAENQFGIALDVTGLSTARVRSAKLLDAKNYRRLTLFLQSLGSMVVAFECMLKCTPEFYVDTTGFAFTNFVARLLFGCKVMCYVHYPTVSRDMLKRVASRVSSFNNSADISGSELRTRAKLMYYRLYSLLYRYAGKCADVVTVNSSWTAKNISALWKMNSITNLADAAPAEDQPGHKTKACNILYPPCPIAPFAEFDIEQPRENIILSVAQFRPEKDHVLQLLVFKELLARGKESKAAWADDLRLVLIGAVRHRDDQRLLDGLTAKAAELGIEEQVEFVVNAPFDTVRDYLGRSVVGLHTMRKEHFGICVVEYMAAGSIPVAHASAGPRRDIVVPFNGRPTGFLAKDLESFTSGIQTVLQMPPPKQAELRQNARARVGAFDQEAFMGRLALLLQSFLHS